MNILLTSVGRRVEVFKEYGERPQIAFESEWKIPSSVYMGVVRATD